MSSSRTNSFATGFRGKFGNLFVLTQRRGKSLMGKLPELSSKEPTAKQVAVKEKFLAATEYARRILMNPYYRELYSARGAGMKTGYNVAVGDYFKPPKVTAINPSAYHGNAGDEIRVKAIDDFKVIRVHVTLRDMANAMLEFGDCVQTEDGSDWVYTVTADHTPIEGQQVKAVAYDIPGNTGEMVCPVE